MKEKKKITKGFILFFVIMLSRAYSFAGFQLATYIDNAKYQFDYSHDHSVLFGDLVDVALLKVNGDPADAVADDFKKLPTVFALDRLFGRIIWNVLDPTDKYVTFYTAEKKFNNPMGIATNGVNKVIVADTYNDRLVEFDIVILSNGINLNNPKIIGTAGNQPGQFKKPYGVCYDGSGNIWVADADNHRIQSLNPDGTPRSVINPSGSLPLNLVTDIAVSYFDSGTIYVCDKGAEIIYKLASNGDYMAQTSDSVKNYYFKIDLDKNNNIYASSREGSSNDHITVFNSNLNQVIESYPTTSTSYGPGIGICNSKVNGVWTTKGLAATVGNDNVSLYNLGVTIKKIGFLNDTFWINPVTKNYFPNGINTIQIETTAPGGNFYIKDFCNGNIINPLQQVIVSSSNTGCAFNVNYSPFKTSSDAADKGLHTAFMNISQFDDSEYSASASTTFYVRHDSAAPFIAGLKADPDKSQLSGKILNVVPETLFSFVGYRDGDDDNGTGSGIQKFQYRVGADLPLWSDWRDVSVLNPQFALNPADNSYETAKGYFYIEYRAIDNVNNTGYAYTYENKVILGTVYTLTPTLTFTATLSSTASYTTTSSLTQTLTATNTHTLSSTYTSTLTLTATRTSTITNTGTFTQTFTATSTITKSPQSTSTCTPTLSRTVTNTFTRTSSITPTWTKTKTPTITPTGSRTKSMTVTPTRTRTSTITPTGTKTKTFTASPTRTRTQTSTPTTTITKTFTISLTYTPTYTKTIFISFTPTITPSRTLTSTVSVTLTATYSSTQTYSFTVTNTFTTTITPTFTVTQTSTAAYGLGAAVEYTGSDWYTGGSMEWTVDTFTAYFGGTSAVSGRIGDNDNTFMQTTVNFNNYKILSFYWKVASEAAYDYLLFYVDDENLGEISGSIDWENMQFVLKPGLHTLRWEYAKDESDSDLDDSGWVDKVEFFDITPSITPTLTNTGTETLTLTQTPVYSSTITDSATFVDTATPTYTNTLIISPTCTYTTTPFLTSTPTFTTTPTLVLDAYEDDGSYLNASTITGGTRQVHSIMPAGDHDWVKFELTYRSDVVLETSGTGDDDTVLTLYSGNNMSGDPIITDDDGGANYYSKISVTLDAGVYYVLVTPFNSSDIIEQYNLDLTINVLPTPTITPTMVTNCVSLDAGFGSNGYVNNDGAGGAGYTQDKGSSVVIGSDNNIYVTGSTAISGQYPMNKMALWKTDNSGNVTVPYTCDSSRGVDITKDLSGNIWVVGIIWPAYPNYSANLALWKYVPGTGGTLVLNMDDLINDHANNTDVVTGIFSYTASSDGHEKILITGTSNISGGGTSLFVIRYDLVTMSVDTTFGTNGVVVVVSSTYPTPGGIAVDSTGKIYIAGYIYGGSGYEIALWKLSETGTLQSGWPKTVNNSGYAYGNAVAIDKNDYIYVAGSMSNGVDDDMVIYKFDQNGNQSWVSPKIYSNGSYEDGAGILIDTCGRVVATGYAFDASYLPIMFMARYFADGTPDLSFGNGTNIVSYTTAAGAMDHSMKSAVYNNYPGSGANYGKIVTTGGLVIFGVTNGYDMTLWRYNENCGSCTPVPTQTP